MDDQILRTHLVELLNGGSAHIAVEAALADFPPERINERIGGSPHSAWELLEHIRLAQADILEFSRDPDYREKTFPDDYWPADEGTVDEWNASVSQVLTDLGSMRDLVLDPSNSLSEPFPWGTGQTLLREAMLVADHNAYHLGQLMLLKKMLS